MWLPKFLALLPFSVNVSGRKHDLICAVGRQLQPISEPVQLEGIQLNVKPHPKAHIVAYAGANFMHSFRKSDLGNYLTTHLSEGDLFVDAGANLGGFSFMGKRLGAEVIAIEADPTLAAFLAENEAAFGTTKSVALSDEEGTATFYISDENIGGNSLVMSKKGWENSGYSRECTVRTARLDSLPELHSGKKVKLLKIDVEGHEEAVVKGADGLFRNQSVEAVWCEVRGATSDRNPNSYQAVCAYLSGFGFTPFLSSDQHQPFDWQAASDVPQFFDLLFKK